MARLERLLDSKDVIVNTSHADLHHPQLSPLTTNATWPIHFSTNN